MKWSPCWVWEKGEIPDDICDYIINTFNENDYENGKIIEGVDKTSIRNVSIQFNNVNWINALLCGYIRYANSENFNYNLSDVDKESAQISRYSEGEYYQEHTDFGEGKSFTRKLSLTVQLSDENDYEGGDLILRNDMLGINGAGSRGKGSVIVFDSRTLHQVTPVTSGTRYSLVKLYHGDEPLK